MNPSSPRCPSDETHVSKFTLLGQQLTTCHSFQHSQPSSDFLGLGYIPHSQAQAQGRATCQNLQSLGETQALDRATCQNLQSLGQTQALTGSSGSGVSLSLQQLLVNGMGSYSPHLNTQLMQGLQESLGQLRGIAPRGPSPLADASSQALMTALMLLQQKLGHLQTLVQLMAQGDQSNPAAIQQQMATAAGVSTVISELVTAAARLLPQVYQQAPPAVCEERSHLGAGSSSDMAFFQQNGSVNSLGAILGISSGNSRSNASAVRRESNSGFGSFVSETELDGSSELGGHLFGAHVGNFLSNNLQNSIETCPENSLSGSFALGLGAGVGGTINLGEGNRAVCVGNPLMSNISMEINSFLEDHDLRGGFKDDEDDGETETLPPGSYELIEMDAMEILAEHTHFCEICGKGFKRDANLRMHMRGHGDEYKTVAALAKPGKSTQDVSSRKPRRYSCPYPGCKRNKKHKKFLPLKALLCVKNHYRRSHCPKMLTCNKCKAKKFSVVADLKTHEKHCGREKWKCSCGTTFSRKDKLLGHVGLFVGHTPAMPLHETDSGGSGGGMERKKSESGTASGNATTHFSLTESGVHSGRRDESSFEYGYGLGLSGSKLDSVSVSSNGDVSGSRLKSDGKGTGEEGMTLAAAHITPTKDGLEASSGP